MPPDINQIEEERKGKLNQARKAAILANDVLFDATHNRTRLSNTKCLL